MIVGFFFGFGFSFSSRPHPRFKLLFLLFVIQVFDFVIALLWEDSNNQVFHL